MAEFELPGELIAPDALKESETEPIQLAAGIPVDLIFQDFYKRHAASPILPDLPRQPPFIPENWKDYYRVSYAVLCESEPLDTLMKLLDHPDKNVRTMAIRYITPGKPRLWDMMDEEQREIVVSAAIDTLIEDVETGTRSGVANVFWTIGDTAAPAVPHLIWASDNSASPVLRVQAMDLAASLDPDSPAVAALIARRRADPVGDVRFAALQTTLRRIGGGFPGVPPIGVPQHRSDEKSLQVAAAVATGD